jgi:hypothetical protein
MRTLSWVFLSLVMAGTACAESFTFNATLRAGRFAGADWEIGIGNISNSESTQNFNHLESPGNNHWGGPNTWHTFQIGWLAATNTAFVSVWNANGTPTTATITNTGTPLGVETIWTIPVNNFFLSAAARPGDTSISLQNVSLSSGVQVLSGGLPNSITVSQSGSGSSYGNFSPIVINPASAGGNWTLSGQIRFTGLTSQGGVAQNSQLQLLFGATGVDTPEAGTVSLIGLGLIGIAVYRRRLRGDERA